MNPPWPEVILGIPQKELECVTGKGDVWFFNWIQQTMDTLEKNCIGRHRMVHDGL